MFTKPSWRMERSSLQLDEGDQSMAEIFVDNIMQLGSNLDMKSNGKEVQIMPWASITNKNAISGDNSIKEDREPKEED